MLPSQFPYNIIHNLLIKHFFIDYLLLPKFFPGIYSYRAIYTKNDFLLLDIGVFYGAPFTPQNIHHHLNHSKYYIAGFLHQCIYTLQHIPVDGSFYIACIQSQSLRLLLHCNICRMEHLYHEIRLNAFFLRFQLTMHVFTFSFYRFCSQFLK